MDVGPHRAVCCHVCCHHEMMQRLSPGPALTQDLGVTVEGVRVWAVEVQ